MPQFAPLTLADGQVTPVNKTFSVGTLVEGLAQYFERTAGQIQSQPMVTIKVATNNRASGINRIPVRLAVPYTDPVTGTVSVSRFNGEFLIPNTVPQSVRDDLHGYSKSLISSPVMSDIVRKVEGLY